MKNKLLRTSGFSLVELLVSIGVLGVVTTIAIIVVGDVRNASREEKLAAQVKSLNSAVQVYLANGGSIAADLSGKADPAGEVIAKLKSMGLETEAHRIVGLKGSFVDKRLVPVLAGANPDEARAYWDDTAKRFKIGYNIVGVSEWVFADAPTTPLVAESRNQRLQYSDASTWVWDYTNYNDSVVTSPTTISTGPGGYATTFSGIPTYERFTLDPPSFSIDGGTHDIEVYDSPLVLTNTNPVGTSVLYVSIDGGTPALYTGPIAVDTWPTDVEAYAASIDLDTWDDSINDANNYLAVRDPDVDMFITVTTVAAAP